MATRTALAMKAHDLLITEGNSKEKLLPQLSDIGRYGKQDRQPFRVLVVDRFDNSALIGLLINGLESLGKNGECWRIIGLIIGEASQSQPITGRLAKFVGEFDTRIREGWLDAENQDDPLRIGGWNVPGTHTDTETGAPICTTCGIPMQRAGSCFVCSNCGSTSGCS